MRIKCKFDLPDMRKPHQIRLCPAPDTFETFYMLFVVLQAISTEDICENSSKNEKKIINC
jgi:hypothetical protein